MCRRSRNGNTRSKGRLWLAGLLGLGLGLGLVAAPSLSGVQRPSAPVSPAIPRLEPTPTLSETSLSPTGTLLRGPPPTPSQPDCTRTPTALPPATALPRPSPSPSRVPARILVADDVWHELGDTLRTVESAAESFEYVAEIALSGPPEPDAPRLLWSWIVPEDAIVLRQERWYAVTHVTGNRADLTCSDLGDWLTSSDEVRYACADEGRLARSLLAELDKMELAQERVDQPSWEAAKEYVALHRGVWALLPWEALDHRVRVLPITASEGLPTDETNGGSLVRSLLLANPESVPGESVALLTDALWEDAPLTVEIVSVGDIMLDRYVGQMIDDNGPDYPFDGEGVRSLLASADIAFGNLECPVSERGRQEDKGYEFRAKPSVIEGLANAGLDILCLANNHTGDYGDLALVDTLDLLGQSGIATVGAGRTVTEAYGATLLTANGLDVAFLAYNEILPRWFEAKGASPGSAFIDEDTMVTAVGSAKTSADLVVVACHWGVEYSALPIARQKRYAEALANAGADLVIGHHPHVVQGLDFGTQTLVAYSLGNFVFDQGFSKQTSEGAALWCLLDETGVRVWRLIPYAIARGQPAVLSPEDGASVTGRMLSVTDSSGCLPR